MATSPRRVWCELALVGSRIEASVLVTIDEEAIVAVDGDVPAPPDAERLRGLTLPGFANAHSHAFHRALRGRTHRTPESGAGDFWGWREQMYAVADGLTPENYLPLARATFAEMLLAGYTCVGEFHYVHHRPGGEPYGDPNAMGSAIVEAARQAGIRLTLLDACYLRAGAKQPTNGHQQRFSDGTARQWASRVEQLSDAPMCKVGAAIHSVRAVDADSIALVARHAHDHRRPLHAHVSEQIDENVQAELEFGCTPTEILAQQGALSSRFTAVHATHLTANDIDLYARSQSSCCFCPTTERDLADGIGPSGALMRAGVPLCIGSDQHAVIDPLEEMRAIEMNERLHTMRRGTHGAMQLLAAGARNGYRALGWDNAELGAGGLADLTTVSLESVRLADAPLDHLVDAVVFAAQAADITHVMVGGRTVVADGRHVSIDVAAELRESVAAVTAGTPP